MPVSFRSLTDKDIPLRLQDATRQERESTLVVLMLLCEMDRRELYLKLGYPSLFEYCTSALGYSKSAAGRRIQTARCVARFSCVYEMLERNEVNLSTVSQVSRALTEVNHKELLSRICGKSQDEAQAILAEYQPCGMPRDRVRTVVVRVPAPVAPDAAVGGETGACEKSAYSRSGSDVSETSSATLAGAATQAEKRIMLQFAVHPDFMVKLNRIKSLASHRLPSNASLEQVFELAMDSMIEREDPAKRIARREECKASAKRNQPPSKNPRHIPAATRDQVFVKDQQQCAYVGANGRRCTSRHLLQIDHIKPVARGGASTLANLRLLCAYHNRLEAERLMGVRRPESRGASTIRERPVPWPRSLLPIQCHVIP